MAHLGSKWHEIYSSTSRLHNTVHPDTTWIYGVLNDILFINHALYSAIKLAVLAFNTKKIENKIFMGVINTDVQIWHYTMEIHHHLLTFFEGGGIHSESMSNLYLFMNDSSFSFVTGFLILSHTAETENHS